jgi:very-short-patch-repair endonuclease
MRKKGANREQVIARLAANQHGVVAAAQLRGAGIPDYSVTRRAQAGRLHRLHRGVYAVGHTKLTFEGRCIAAALAVGEVAVVSHRSAAAIWAMLPAHSGPIDVTVPGDGGRRKRHGITVHRSSTLVAGVSTRRNGIGVTKPARTLRDLHRTVPQPVFRRAIRRALDLRLISDADLEGDADLTRSELERIFLNLCRRHRFPRPEVNARLGPYEVDFVWRDRHLVVETDGFRHHANRAAFESDRGRDAQLQRLGFRVLRFTHRQLTRERSAVVAALHALLSQRSLTPNL